jgi:hypothetical protein
VRKYVTQFVALEKNAEKGIPNHMAAAHIAYREGRLEEFYEPLVVGDAALERGLTEGRLTVDTRLRDALRALGFGESSGERAAGYGRLGVAEAALYAGESSALQESDLALALGACIDDLDARIGVLERSALARLRGAVRRGTRT